MGSRAVAALLLLLACAASVRAVQLRHVQKLSALPYCDEVHDRVDAIDMDEDQVEALQAWASAQTDGERARAQAKLGEKVGADGLAALGLGPAMPSLAQLTLRTRKCQPRVDPADGITKNKNQVKANTNIKLQHLPQDFFAPDVSDNFFEDEWKKAEEEFQKGGPEDRVGALGKNKKKGPNGETVSDSLSAAEQKRLKEGKKLLSRKELLFQSKLLAEQRRLEEVRHKRFIGETKLQRERWQRIREQVTKTRLQTKRAEQRVKDAAAQLSTLGPIDRNWIPARNKQLAPASAVASSQVGWTYMFWLYVKERPKAWAQILHKGGDKRQRGPAIWIKPNQLGLHVRSATSKGWNTGVDTPHVKGLNLWTHVAITHSKSKLTIYFNGEVAIERALPPPLQNDAPLWSSAPFYEPAKVELADFKYMPSVASVALIQSIIARRAYFPAQQ